MERAALGRTGIEVSRICIGCWQAAGWATSDDARFIATVRHALDSGLNFLDTAIAYGDGHSERLVGKAVAGRRDRVVIATKFWHDMSRPVDVRKSLERSLSNLGTDYLDLFQQHWPPPDIPLEDTIGAMEQLKKEGKIRVVGVSNWMIPEWTELADPSRVECLQPCYSLLWRSIEPDVLGLCRRHRIAVIPYSPLCQGLLTGRFRRVSDVPEDCRKSNRLFQTEMLPKVLDVVEVLQEAAAKCGKTPVQTALRWLLDQEGVTAPIVGASSPDQIDENLGAMGWRLPGDDWRRLSDASKALSEGLGPLDSLWNFHPKKT